MDGLYSAMFQKSKRMDKNGINRIINEDETKS